MQVLRCNVTSFHIALLCKRQCSSSLILQTYDHSIHIPGENTSFSFSHSYPNWKDKTVILSSWIDDKHTFKKPEWFACFHVTSSHQTIQKNSIPGSRDPVLICKSRKSQPFVYLLLFFPVSSHRCNKNSFAKYGQRSERTISSSNPSQGHGRTAGRTSWYYHCKHYSHGCQRQPTQIS